MRSIQKIGVVMMTTLINTPEDWEELTERIRSHDGDKAHAMMIAIMAYQLAVKELNNAKNTLRKD
jgi:hypothetical protein